MKLKTKSRAYKKIIKVIMCVSFCKHNLILIQPIQCQFSFMSIIFFWFLSFLYFIITTQIPSLAVKVKCFPLFYTSFVDAAYAQTWNDNNNKGHAEKVNLSIIINPFPYITNKLKLVNVSHVRVQRRHSHDFYGVTHDLEKKKKNGNEL